jgi:hypothetical protein
VDTATDRNNGSAAVKNNGTTADRNRTSNVVNSPLVLNVKQGIFGHRIPPRL